MTTKDQLRKVGIELEKELDGYRIVLNGIMVGWFYKEHHPGQIRSLRQFVGSWDLYDTWVYISESDQGINFSAETFDEGKNKLLNLIGFQCTDRYCSLNKKCTICPLSKEKIKG